MWRFISVIVLALAPLARGDEGAKKTLHPLDNKYAALAAYYKSEQMDFSQIFTALCRQALSNADNDPQLKLEDHVRSMFGGLWLWTQGNGGTPILQGRMDWAFHFIGGGAFEGYFDIGHSAALVKERIDSRDPHNRFDLDDMAATILGARWMNLAVRPEGRRWIERWASGTSTLARSLPKLQYGQMPQGKEASEQAIEKIRNDMQSALTPDSPTTPPVSPPPSKN